MSGVVLRDNWVLSDNAGLGTPQGECKDNPPVPGDCGGGIHLVAVTNSKVENNIVAYNADGILLTDEFGPTAHNVISGNRVLNNLAECGIVLAGHNGKAFDPMSHKLTGAAGVYANLVENILTRNNGVSRAVPGSCSPVARPDRPSTTTWSAATPSSSTATAGSRFTSTSSAT